MPSTRVEYRHCISRNAVVGALLHLLQLGSANPLVLSLLVLFSVEDHLILLPLVGEEGLRLPPLPGLAG